MPRLIEVDDNRAIALEECVEALASAGFTPEDEATLQHAALQLRRLGNNNEFLGDLIVDELSRRHEPATPLESYGPQVIMLSQPGGDFFIRANIWPSAVEHMLRASGHAAFAFDLPHDHNFDFLTLGYFGPGYWSDYYEYDYEAVTGWCGEPVSLRYVERRRLEPGQIMHYRAHRDIHRQLAPDALSVSLNVMHSCGAQGWLDQYRFDLERGEVGAILSRGSSEAFLRIAVGLGGEEARDLAERFGRRHPSDRMRLCAWDALASVAEDTAEWDELWRIAEASGSRLVAMEAKSRRTRLQSPI